MSEKNNDKWLEKIISKTINSGKPQFDAEKFKQKFPDEYKILQSRASKQKKSNLWKTILSDPVSSLATAAVIILMVTLFLFFSGPEDNTTPLKVHNVQKSNSELLTPTALMNAYLEGGMEAVDEKNREAAKMLNRKPEDITIYELLIENNNI